MTENIRTNFCATCKEQADRIEALTAENERLMEEGARLALEAAEVLFQQYGWHGVTKKLDPAAIVKGAGRDRD